MLPIVILWIHLLAAMTWIGGMLFVWLVLRPSLKKPVLDPQAQAVLSRVEGRFRTIRWYSLLTLLGTGLFNLVHEGSSAVKVEWGGVLMIKLFFVAAVMGITGINDFLISPTKTSTGSANRTKDLLTGIIFLLALLIVFIGVYLREM